MDGPLQGVRVVELTGIGPAPFAARDQKAFADQLDRLLQRLASG